MTLNLTPRWVSQRTSDGWRVCWRHSDGTMDRPIATRLTREAAKTLRDAKNRGRRRG